MADLSFICVGDKITFAGCYTKKPNPDRRWWSFWRPRYVPSTELQPYVVTASYTFPSSSWMLPNG